MPKHIVFYSSGIGSWATAKRVAEQYGTENLILMFADTLIEDNDNYRFFVDSLASIFGWPKNWFSDAFFFCGNAGIKLAYNSDWRRFVSEIPPADYKPSPYSYPAPYPNPNIRRTRKEVLNIFWGLVFEAMPEKGKVIRVCDGRTPFELWKDESAIANNRMPFCSEHLKQEVSRAALCDIEPENLADWHRLYRKESGRGVFCYPDRQTRKQLAAAIGKKVASQRAKACPYPKPQAETVIHVGIGWDEIHRLPAIVDAWQPWEVRAEITEAPYMDKNQLIALAKSEGLEAPRLYNYGLNHANCGGGCVRAGQAHWKHVLKVLPEVFALWEREENKMRASTGKNIAMLSKDVNGKAEPYPLSDLRRDVETGGQIDLFDWGGCGCFAVETA